MLRCKEVSALIGSGGVARAPWRTRLGVWIHLRMCQFCRDYQRSIRALGEAARGLEAGQPAPLEAIERIVRRVKREE
ncbi:MAG: hypothetical protein ABR551_03075 [Gemmatimonadales bacterium]